MRRTVRPMNRRQLIPFLGAAVAMTAMTVTGHAGEGQYNYAWCSKNADGSGNCGGSLYGFRHTPNATDYAEFVVQSSATTWYFNGSYNGANYSCSVPSTNPSLGAMAPLAIANHGWFNLNWNSSGQCTWLTVESGSSSVPF
jgi:hypothetical protein